MTILVLFLTSLAFGLELPMPSALDLPGDDGRAVLLIWPSTPYETSEVSYVVQASDSPEGPFGDVARFPSTSHYRDERKAPFWTWRRNRDEHFFVVRTAKGKPLESGKKYYFRLGVDFGEGPEFGPIVSAVPKANWFDPTKLNNFIFMVLFSGVVLWFIGRARRKELFLRRIPGLNAVEEAIGRATEMGRPIYYLTGRLGMSSVSTIAATIILRDIAKRAAEYEAQLRVPHTDPVVMAVCREVVKGAYLEAGRPDAYNEEINFYVTDDQFSYTMAVDGMMVREKPAAVFFMGYYYAESLLLAEVGASVGAIQIAGTDAEHQLPFFVTACDYTLIGEELYAASAYLSKEPALVGTLRAQDVGKAFLMAFIVLGTLASTVGLWTGIEHKVGYFLDILRDFS
ncbi:MAG: hypothetical protein DRP95_04500 [Candidatus Latescibacterota bacterium]|nr:MAG: hypothetical protein DRP95_04500 [Candidatus Latescibacterota bacterium]